MAPHMMELIRAGFALDPSLGHPAGVDAAWLEDVVRRLQEVRDGTTDFVNLEEHNAYLRNS